MAETAAIDEMDIERLIKFAQVKGHAALAAWMASNVTVYDEEVPAWITDGDGRVRVTGFSEMSYETLVPKDIWLVIATLRQKGMEEARKNAGEPQDASADAAAEAGVQDRRARIARLAEEQRRQANTRRAGPPQTSAVPAPAPSPSGG